MATSILVDCNSDKIKAEVESLKEIKSFVKKHFKKTEIFYLTQKITMNIGLYKALSERRLFDEMFCLLERDFYLKYYEKLRRMENKGYVTILKCDKKKGDTSYYLINKLVVLKEKFNRTLVTLKIVKINERIKTYYLIFGKKSK